MLIVLLVLPKNQKYHDEETVFAGLPIENNTQRLAFDAGRKFPITPSDIQNATVKGSVLRKTDWSKSNQNVYPLQVCRRRDNLSMVNLCFMFSDRIAIASALNRAV
ncbi:unnamed protein product [Hymenolepis diminuta]|uniref:Uncharacterized protein n=1 Tax=Hymenolepis diminuta TaxID=6216 RepID=A0A564YMF3_HYMDI|nr:unnamed protein product [Hymenolepis diminuta]